MPPRLRLRLFGPSVTGKVASEAVSPRGRDPPRPLSVRELAQDRCIGAHVDTVNRHHCDFAECVLFTERFEESFIRLTGACPRATAADTELHYQTILAGGLAAAVVAQLRERGPASNDAT